MDHWSGLLEKYNRVAQLGTRFYVFHCRRKGRMTALRSGSRICRENAGDRYRDRPMRSGIKAY